MKINIIAVGKIKEDYLKAGIAEFVKRLQPFCSLRFSECAEEKLAENPSAAERSQALDKEGERLLKLVRKDDFVLVLDVAGKMLSSEELASLLEQKGLAGQSNIALLIGGAYGLSERVRERADLRLSFSRMTFTHQMIRLLLVEQIYRAFKIVRKEKYHN